MLWVWVIVAAAVAGLAMLCAFAVVLWRKTRLVLDELAAVGRHLDAALEAVDRIGARSS